MVLAIAYILMSALVIFNVEPDSFETFLMPCTGRLFHLRLWVMGISIL